MGVRQILPDRPRVLVDLDEAIAPRRVARGLVDDQQVAVGVEVSLAKVDQRVGLRRLDRGALVPHLAERQPPLVQHVAAHRDQHRMRAVARGVERDAGAGARRVVHGDARLVGAHRLPELGRVVLIVLAPLVEQRVAAAIGVGKVARRRRLDEDQVAARDRPEKGNGEHDCRVVDEFGDRSAWHVRPWRTRSVARFGVVGEFGWFYGW